MKLSKYLQSKHMSKHEVDWFGVVLTIKGVTTEASMGKVCAVLHFEEDGSKPMILNITNARTLAWMFDSVESDDWTGKSINVFHDHTVGEGANAGGLRIRSVSDAFEARAAV